MKTEEDIAFTSTYIRHMLLYNFCILKNMYYKYLNGKNTQLKLKKASISISRYRTFL